MSDDVLKRKRENSRKLRSSPAYRKREAEWNKEYRKNPVVEARKVRIQITHERLKKYNITVDDYNALLVKQDYSCAICKKHVSELSRNLAVDHCHSTLKVRGLLCLKCNVGLGYFKDNPVSLSNAIEYLQISKGNTKNVLDE